MYNSKIPQKNSPPQTTNKRRILKYQSKISPIKINETYFG